MTTNGNELSAAASEMRSLLREMNDSLWRNIDTAKDKFVTIQQLVHSNSTDSAAVRCYASAACNIATFLMDNDCSDFSKYLDLLERMPQEFMYDDAVIGRICAAYDNFIWRFSSQRHQMSLEYLRKMDDILIAHPGNTEAVYWLSNALHKFIRQSVASVQDDCLRAHRKLARLANDNKKNRDIQWHYFCANFDMALREADGVEARRYYEEAERISDYQPDDGEIRNAASELGCRVIVKLGTSSIPISLEILSKLERASQDEKAWPGVRQAFAAAGAYLIRHTSVAHPLICVELRDKLRAFGQLHRDDKLIGELAEVAEQH